MANRILKTGFACALSLGAVAATANAGGFARGEADTDILFEEGKVVMRSGVTYVAPQRKFDTVKIGTVRTSNDGVYTDSYFIPSFAAKVSISDNLACAVTYTTPFGASATFGADAQLADLIGNPAYVNAYRSKEFKTNEYGATCDVKFQAGKGNLHFLGGVFIEDFAYTADSYRGTLHLEDDAAFGYRLGTAYDIPEYKMRAQLMYRSKVDHDANEGNFDVLNGGSLFYPAYGYGTLPQSLKLSLQSGVAPGWLVYGSVKWTDWSVLDALHYNIAGTNFEDVYNWNDGWTLQAGVAHSFTEKVAGTVNVTWDSGVGTGADIASDTWTFAAGTSIKAGPGEIRLGGAVSYLTAGSQSTADGAAFTATANGDWAYAISASYKIAF